MCNTCKLEHRIKLSALLLSAVFLLTMLFTTAVNIHAGINFDERKFLDFVQTMDQFHRKYIGCPPAGYPPEIQCNKGAGEWDAKMWESLKVKGKKLF